MSTAIAIPIVRAATLRRMGSKSLPLDQAKLVYAAVRAYVDTHHKGNIKDAERETKIPYATLNGLYNGKIGIGLATAQRVAGLVGKTFDELTSPNSRATRASIDATPVWGTLPNWTESEVSAREKLPQEKWPLVERARGLSSWGNPEWATTELVLSVVTVIEQLDATKLAAEQRGRTEAATIDAEREALQIEAERQTREMEARGEKAPSLVSLMNKMREEGWKPPSNDAAPVSTNDAPAPKNGRAKK